MKATHTYLTDRNNVGRMLEGGVEVKLLDTMGEEAREVREYTERLRREAEHWKVVNQERRRMVKNTEKNARAVEKEEIVVDEEQRFRLTVQEKAALGKIPSYKAALDQLNNHR